MHYYCFPIIHNYRNILELCDIGSRYDSFFADSDICGVHGSIRRHFYSRSLIPLDDFGIIDRLFFPRSSSILPLIFRYFHPFRWAITFCLIRLRSSEDLSFFSFRLSTQLFCVLLIPPETLIFPFV